MKKVLLLAAAALMVTSASAQLMRPQAMHSPARPQMQLCKQEAQMKVATQRLSDSPVVKAPGKADDVNVWYNRPAGAYSAIIVVEDGSYAGMLYAPYLSITPYVDYTFFAHSIGLSENATFEWDVQHWGANDDIEPEQQWVTVPGPVLTWQWGYETDEVPVLFWADGEKFGSFQYASYRSGSPDGITPVNEYIAKILSVPSTMEIWGYEFLKSSKTFSLFGDNGGQNYSMTYYSGAKPHGENKDGWWFGKNGGTSHGNRIDGIAQAFEAPPAPYLLNQVVLDYAFLKVAAPVEMTCKIYKLDEIPAYNDSVSVTLPDEPGELIAKGHATVTPETDETTGGLVFFTLYDEDDGLEYDISPTIDCAILVVIDGYNEPEMAGLLDFSAMISSDIHTDEGFGELAYLKYGIMDEDGNLDHYVWAGLNHFFDGDDNEMMTGLTIFLNTENPFLVLNDDEYSGQYMFPAEGGRMEKPNSDHTQPGLEFKSWWPSDNEIWILTCNGDKVPDWLHITLEDQMADGDYSGLVYADVIADPLPKGEKYREAIVRFEYPGAYVDYKFMQRAKPAPPRPIDHDWNGDGNVNISDVNLLINLILTEEGEYNVADLNELIAYILGLKPIW